MMNSMELEHIFAAIKPTIVFAGIKSAIIIVIGWFIINWLKKAVIPPAESRLSHHSALLLSNAFFYFGWAIIFVTILHEFGFQLSAIVGAVGIIGLAIGFAAQTSIANIISGFFILLERPFIIGDQIKYDTVTGIVEEIDLMGIQVRTPDNKSVRIPHELLIKKELTNITYYPERLLLVKVQINEQTSIQTVMEILRETAHQILGKEHEVTILPISIVNAVVELRLSTMFAKDDINAVYNRFAAQLLQTAQEKELWLTVSKID